MPNHPERPAGLATPGLRWRQRKNLQGGRTEAHWIADQVIVKRGYQVKTMLLWSPSDGTDPTPADWLAISSRCIKLQAEMNTWAHGGVATDPRSIYNGTLRSLIRVYKTDIDSGYHELRYRTGLSYASKLATLDVQVGEARLRDLTFRDFKRWHEGFRGADQVGRAHGLMTMVRIVVKFGALLELPDCARLTSMLGNMDFQTPQRRTVFITYAQAKAVIAEAHRRGQHSIALAQAIMFETGLRQKDVIGEWLPQAEPGNSVILWHGLKWLHGLHWRDISPDLVLSKRISKSLRGRRAAATPGAGKVEEFDLKIYPMVQDELSALGLASQHSATQRNGPLIICEATGKPWTKHFSKVWRDIATAAGVPTNVCNKDSRAGGITEGDEAGATLEGLRHHAGHTTTAMTVRYVRGGLKQRNKVAQLRVAKRGEK